MTRKELKDVANEIAGKFYIVLVTKNSYSSKIRLGCVLGGSYKARKKGTSQKIVQNLGVDDVLDGKIRTRKIGCPFELIGWKDKVTQKWYLRVECGMHNHEVGTSMN